MAPASPSLPVDGTVQSTRSRRDFWLLGPVAFATGLSMGFAMDIGLAGMDLAPFFAAAIILLKLLSGAPYWSFPDHRKAGFLGLTSSTMLLLFGLGLSTIGTQDAYFAYRFLVVGGQYFFTLVFLYAVLSALSRDQIKLLIRAYLLGSFLLMVLGIGVYFLANEFGRSMDWIWVNGRLRMWSGANALAPHFTFATILAFYWFSYENRSFARLFLFSSAALFSIMLTGSNTGLIVFLLSIGAMIFVVNWRIGIILAAIAAITASTIVVNLTAILDNENLRVLHRFFWLAEADIEDAGSFETRFGILQSGWDHILANPLLGAGASAALDHTLLFSLVNPGNAQPHNALVLIWVEGGFFAALGWLLWFASAAFMAMRTRGPIRLTILVLVGAIFTVTMMRAHAYQVWLTAPLFMLLCHAFHMRFSSPGNAVRGRPDRRSGPYRSPKPATG